MRPRMFLTLLIAYPLYNAAYFSLLTRYEEESILWKDWDVSTPWVYRSHKQGVLLVQTKNFLAVANDHFNEYNLN